MRIQLLWGMFLCGVLSARQPALPAHQKSTIAGVVSDAQSGKPLPGAEVHLRWDDPPNIEIQGGGPPPPKTMWQVTVDARGRYEFRDLAAGHYYVTVQANGFGVSEHTVYGARVTLAEGESAAAVDFRLTPEMSVSGRIVDGRGRPVPRAGTAFLRERYVDGRKQWVPIPGGLGASNERGEFRFAGVWTGPVIVQAFPMRVFTGPGFESKDPEMPFFPTYFPDTTDLAKATRIGLSPGDHRGGLELKLLDAPGHRISGRVTDHSGKPAGICNVGLLPENPPWGMPGGFLVEMSDRPFDFQPVPTGSYLLMVSCNNPWFHRESMAVTGDLADLEIRLPKPVQIQGEVLGIPDLKLHPEDLVFTFSPDMEGTSMKSANMVSTNGAKFVLDGILPGRYRMGAIAFRLGIRFPSRRLERIEYGDQDALHGPVEVSARPAHLRLTFTTEPAASGSVRGTVRKGNAVAGRSFVWLLHADAARRLNQGAAYWALTDQKGRFTVQPIEPGEYLAFALEETEEGFWKDPQRFEKFAGGAKAISVAKQGSVEVDLQVTSPPT